MSSLTGEATGCSAVDVVRLLKGCSSTSMQHLLRNVSPMLDIFLIYGKFGKFVDDMCQSRQFV